MKSPWTPRVAARFNELLLEKPMLSYGMIADRLSEEFNLRLTRNACIGYGNRIGWPRRGQAEIQRIRKAMSKPRPRVRKARPAPRKPQPPRRPRKLRIWQLAPHECRWPTDNVSPFFFCAAPQLTGSSYCVTHTRVACPALMRR